MKFDSIKDVSDEKFRHLTGVKWITFNKMVGMLKESVKNRKTQRSINKNLNIENMLLMALECLREYRKLWDQ